MSTGLPQISNEELSDLGTALRRFAEGIGAGIEICLPVVVVSYNRVFGRVTVVPAVKENNTKDIGNIDFTVRGQFEVPVKRFCCGGFAIDYPIFVGDKGWVISSDDNVALLRRDANPLSGVLEKDEDVANVQEVIPQPYANGESHCLDQGFFIPDCWEVFYAPSVKTVEGTGVSLGDMYIGGSVPKTIEIKKIGKQLAHVPVEEPIDGLASMVLSRGTEDSHILLSVGSKAGISIRKSEIKITLKNGDEPAASVTLNSESGEVSIDAKACRLPANTTVGGALVQVSS